MAGTRSAGRIEAGRRPVRGGRLSGARALEVGGLGALVHWEGANERTREIVESRLRQYLGYRIEEIELRPLSGDEAFASSGYRPNLKPVGWLAMTFESPIGEDSRILGQVFVVGEKDGNPLITVAVPKP